MSKNTKHASAMSTCTHEKSISYMCACAGTRIKQDRQRQTGRMKAEKTERHFFHMCHGYDSWLLNTLRMLFI